MSLCKAHGHTMMVCHSLGSAVFTVRLECYSWLTESDAGHQELVDAREMKAGLTTLHMKTSMGRVVMSVLGLPLPVV